MSAEQGEERDPRFAELSAAERDELIESIAQKIVDRRLAAAAIFLLESSKPISFLTSQAMLVFEPVAQALFDTKTYLRFQKLLEERENVERLIVCIEHKESERLERERAKRAERRRPSRRQGEPRNEQ